MNTRRDALRIFAITPAALPAFATEAQQTQEIVNQPGHVHTQPAGKVVTPAKPAFFQPAEFKSMEEITERIIPRTDTPGAKDAGVALLIDKAIISDPTLMQPYRAGLADLNSLAASSYGGEFASLSEEKQIQLLTALSLNDESAQGKFFAMVKDMTVDAYYKTEAGLKTELGWHGNTYLQTFEGCTHPEHQS